MICLGSSPSIYNFKMPHRLLLLRAKILLDQQPFQHHPTPDKQTTASETRNTKNETRHPKNDIRKTAPPFSPQIFSIGTIFSAGGIWMATVLAHIRQQAVADTVQEIPFNYYGLLKYSFALASSAGAGVLLYGVCPLLTPLAIFVFYWAEVQLLFLFPLLIDRVPHPIRESIRLTGRIGVGHAIRRVMPIAFFMLSGWCNRRDPLQRWYIGCAAVLLWYEEIKEIGSS